MESKGLQTSEGRISLSLVVTIVGGVLAAIAALPPEQLEIFKYFLPIIIWPIAVVVSAYTIGRSIVKYAQLRDVPPLQSGGSNSGTN